MKAETVQRLLNLVPAPLPLPPCPVCADDKRVAVGTATGPCPHCQLGIPVADVPLRADTPRTEIAG